MYINNITGKPIKDITFDGFLFTVPPGVSLCWDKFGEFLTTKIYPLDKDTSGTPPVLAVSSAEWKGVLYVEVRRYEINAELIPNRSDLIKIAKSRGVDAATIENWKEDETIENVEMARIVNEVDVPDFIKFPAAEVVEKDTATADAADAAVAGADANPAPATPASSPAPAPTPAARAPRVVAKRKAGSMPGTQKKKAGA